MDKVFIYKENTDDRDCVKYINIEDLEDYSSSKNNISLSGACFCGADLEEIDFDNIITILTKEEFKSLNNFDKAISKLGCGFRKRSQKYKKGLSLHESIKPIIDKLKSEKNTELFEKVKLEEIEYLKDEYNLDDKDIETIFDEYGQDYRDRAIVGYVFDDVDDMAREEAYSMGYAKEENDRYFNYDSFGEDLMDNGNYLLLEDGRIVYFMY